MVFQKAGTEGRQRQMIPSDGGNFGQAVDMHLECDITSQ